MIAPGSGNIDQPAVLVVAAVLMVVGVVLTIVDAVQSRRRRTAIRSRGFNQYGMPRLVGEQPLAEFTAGPDGFGLIWHDAVLAETVADWTRQLEGGAL